MEISELRFRRHGIDLAHVSTSVLLLHVVDVQKPRFVFVVLVMRDAYSRISGDHVIVHGQNGRLLEMDPGHLLIYKIYYYFGG